MQEHLTAAAGNLAEQEPELWEAYTVDPLAIGQQSTIAVLTSRTAVDEALKAWHPLS